jgi:hypothetical protein
VEAFFGPKAAEIDGAPRVLASTLEEIRLCAARRTAYTEPATKFFAGKR